MTLYNESGRPIDPDYEPIIADVYPRMGLPVSPVTETAFNGGDEYDGVVFALNLAANSGYRIPERILAPIAEEIRLNLEQGEHYWGRDFDELAMSYVERIRALDNTTA